MRPDPRIVAMTLFVCGIVPVLGQGQNRRLCSPPPCWRSRSSTGLPRCIV